MSEDLAGQVAAVRAFNRFYTNVIGLVHGMYLDMPYSLTEARLLYEMARRDVTRVADLRRALDAGVQAVAALGGAAPGDKTMLDALVPGVAALTVSYGAARAAAEEGALATVPLQARKGRASYLGERSVGHQDPGATSTALILAALARVVEGQGS